MKLTLLTDNEIYIAICEKYWDVDELGVFAKSVSDIAKQFNKKTPEITKIVKQCCISLSDETFCDSCGQEYLYGSRADYLSSVSQEAWTCDECKMQEIESLRYAKYSCVLKYAESAIAKPVDPYTLSARQMICLAALARFAADEELLKILPYSSIRNIKLTPSEEYDLVLLRELYTSGLLIVSPDSDLNRISLNENSGFSFYLAEVELLLPYPSLKSFIAVIEDELSSKKFRVSLKLDIELFAKEIALQECLSYLAHVLGEHQLQYSAGEKTFLVLNKGLESYSVAQMCSFIWRAAKDAAAFYVRSRVSRDHAAKTVVSNIERQIERSISNEWNVAAYQRNFDHPQSVLS